ncbi:hypothetical protein PDESU_00439 [Pontiella desulfatans]|uniref:Uncharacterized protein n=1 Tax=Pontiella desulfatans TaxID=2750659 RepID=A0A6C2TX49_PONDE|nr:hypothetical protein PDESU_00439 [Pontiella desulfatans]
MQTLWLKLMKRAFGTNFHAKLFALRFRSLGRFFLLKLEACPMVYRGLLFRRRAYPTLNTHIQPKGRAMKKLYIGIDVHKDSIVVALAFSDQAEPTLLGKVSADLFPTPAMPCWRGARRAPGRTASAPPRAARMEPRPPRRGLKIHEEPGGSLCAMRAIASQLCGQQNRPHRFLKRRGLSVPAAPGRLCRKRSGGGRGYGCCQTGRIGIHLIDHDCS